jgi:Fic family protein
LAVKRITGSYRVNDFGGENVRAFVPLSLPPVDPPLVIGGRLAELLTEAMAALGRLDVAGGMVPSAGWFLYGFVRKEAVISYQIEGTQATLEDVLNFEVTERSDHPDDVREVCNYVRALEHARGEIARPRGLPLATRLLCDTHRLLMSGARGADKQPGEIRRSQNWIGGTRPGNARFVPPPPDLVPEALSDLAKWIHAPSPLPPLVRAGLAHVQFETIHPFLDGNGRVGRLLITLLLEHWKLLSSPLLYLSLAFKQHRAEYYQRLADVRTSGDWEGWTEFFLASVKESADDAVDSARRLHGLLGRHHQRLIRHRGATVAAVRLLELLPEHPILMLSDAVKLLGVSKPTAIKAIAALRQNKILAETTGKKRDRVYGYREYLEVLTSDTQPLGG